MSLLKGEFWTEDMRKLNIPWREFEVFSSDNFYTDVIYKFEPNVH